MDADPSFLYGAVALQAGLIDSQCFGEFMEACASWDQDRDGPLPDFLVARGWVQPAARAHLDYLVERKLQQHAGDAKAGVASVTHEIEQSLVSLRNQRLATFLSPLSPASVPGSKTSERYTLDYLHATGGIGRVWLARDAQLGRDVALKELRPEQAGDAMLCARFFREAQITGQLEHPGIVPVYELARRPDSGPPFYTMRFVKGRTLSDAAKAFHQKRAAGVADSLEFSTLLNAFVVVCKTVAYAHSRGVIHRDLKGQNIILGDFGEVIVLDWGLAKLVGQVEQNIETPVAIDPLTDAELTLPGDTLGTPAYMAPEQAAGQLDSIDQQTDVYGLGAMLYQLLTGKAPFSGETTDELLRKVKFDEPLPPKQLWPDVPATLEAACLRAMAKQRSARYTAASELAHEVEQWQEVQRKKAEDALRVSQALYHSLIESIRLWVWRKDLDSRFTFVSTGLSEGIGVKPEDMIGKTDHDFFPELADRIRRDDLHVIQTGQTLRLIEERGSNEKVPQVVEVIKIPIRDSNGAIVGTQGVLWDVTAWKRAENALRESEALYHSLVENIPIHVWRKDTDGRFTFVNKGFCEALAKAPDDLIGKTDFDLFPPELAEKYRRDDLRVLETGHTLRVTEKHPTGHSVEVIKIPIFDAHHHIIGTQGIYWDLTSWNRTQHESHRQ
jgi:PAS domain S-box-containing protein